MVTGRMGKTGPRMTEGQMAGLADAAARLAVEEAEADGEGTPKFGEAGGRQALIGIVFNQYLSAVGVH